MTIVPDESGMETIPVPATTRFPIELEPPERFRPEDPSSWPRVEAGMLLGGDVRGAECAVWRRDTFGPITTAYARVPPILAVEVAGRDENEAAFREKAAWYLARGVQVVWVVLPATREVVVIAPDGESRHRALTGCRRISPCPASPRSSRASSGSSTDRTEVAMCPASRSRAGPGDCGASARIVDFTSMKARASRSRSAAPRVGGGPVSVVLPSALRRTVATEAKRRGLKLSTAIRVLVGERIRDLAEAQELTAVERWQRAQAWATWEKIEAGDRREASQAEVDAVFDRALRRSRQRGR